MITLPLTTLSPYQNEKTSSILTLNENADEESNQIRGSSNQKIRSKQWSKHKSYTVAEIMGNFGEASKAIEPVSISSSITKSPIPIGSTDAVSYEVLYMGKLRMFYKKAPVTFIDDALEKFRAHENERLRRKSISINKIQSNLISHSTDGAISDPSSAQKVDSAVDKSPKHVQNRTSCNENVNELKEEAKVEENGGYYGSTGLLEPSKIGESRGNRTMLLIIGNQELRIISPDAKTILFQKNIGEITQTAKGIQNANCFGFICKEINTYGSIHVGFVFRCESEKVVSEILLRMKCAKSTDEIKGPLYCEHCPMIWFHNLCVDLDGTPQHKMQNLILKRIEELTKDDRRNILMKFDGAQPQNAEEQNSLMMMLIRAHCESRQLNHVHDPDENRNEFLQSNLSSGAILMKAKRTLTNSFDQLMKRKEQGQNIASSNQINKGNTTIGTTIGFRALLPHHAQQQQQQSKKEMSPTGHITSGTIASSDMTFSDSPLENIFRKRASTLGTVAAERIVTEFNKKVSNKTTDCIDSRKVYKTPEKLKVLPTRRSIDTSQHQNPTHSPMMNIFLKVGPSQSKNANTSGNNGGFTPSTNNTMNGTGNKAHPHRKGSWRQAIFKRVVSPSTPVGGNGSSAVTSQPIMVNTVGSITTTPLSRHPISHGIKIKRTKEEIKELWISAIRQQILLNRMEKQNYMLKTKQEEADLKRIKLSYSDLFGCGDTENLGIDLLIEKAENGDVLDISFFRAVCLTGIPKHKRGQVWQLFIKQHMLRTSKEEYGDGYGNITPRINTFTSSPCNSTYEQLLKQLTSHQHAILIDLGRTFPNHPYFNCALGSGQLALFNLLKAYSLLDSDVGYCQGLSFVSGLLLMHLEEEEAFNTLKYFMFEMGGREYYRPDMSGLQLKLYQLNRLIYDQDPDIHLLLYHNDVLPTLYAAPWFLTMFASQFPIGFAARVMDLAFVQGPDVMVKFALVLIQDHKSQLMECCGLEEIMECFKNVLTKISPSNVDEYVRKAFDMKIDRQMLVYGIEYSVMHDESFLAYITDPNSSNRLGKLRKEAENRSLSIDETACGIMSSSCTPPSTSSLSNECSPNERRDSQGIISYEQSELNEDGLNDYKVLSSYIDLLEDKLKGNGEEVFRPLSVTKVLERRILNLNNNNGNYMSNISSSTLSSKLESYDQNKLNLSSNNPIDQLVIDEEDTCSITN